MTLGLHYFFVGFHDVIFNNFHILIGSDQLLALFGRVLLQLTSDLVNIIH
jgi:hypothetical protein